MICLKAMYNERRRRTCKRALHRRSVQNYSGDVFGHFNFLCLFNLCLFFYIFYIYYLFILYSTPDIYGNVEHKRRQGREFQVGVTGALLGQGSGAIRQHSQDALFEISRGLAGGGE